MIPLTVWLDQPDKGLAVDIDVVDFGLATRELARQRGTMCNPRCEQAPAGRLQGWYSNVNPWSGPLDAGSRLVAVARPPGSSGFRSILRFAC